jgi:hypothetical protein
MNIKTIQMTRTAIEMVKVYEAPDGTTFLNMEECSFYEKLLESYDKILKHNEWFYVSCKEDYLTICSYLKMQNGSYCEYRDYREEFKGWLSFDIQGEYAFVNLLEEYREIVSELDAIKDLRSEEVVPVQESVLST